jgi:short-subunit dehydrogenase
MAAYAASKAYVLHFSEAIHTELKSQGVRVMALCPGATDTGFWKVARMDPADTRLHLKSPEFVVARAMRTLEKKHAFVIPGIQNKLTTFGTRFISRRLVTRISRPLVGY